MQTKENFWGCLCPKLPHVYIHTMAAVLLCAALTVPAMAATNTAGNDMSAVAVIGVKLTGNQHKVDQAWDWLKRIWVAWAIINGIGAFIAYITPQFSGFNTLTP